MFTKTDPRDRYLTFIFFLFFFFQPLRDLRFVSFLALQDVILILGLLISISFKKLKLLDYRLSLFTIFSCLLISITTKQYSLNYSENFLNTGKVLVAYGIVSFYIMVFVQQHSNHLRIATYGITFGVALTLIFSFRDFLITSDNTRLVGFSGHANYLAFSGTVCFILAIFFEASSIKLLLFRVIGITAGSIAILLTVSNTAILCVCCTLILRFAGKGYRLLLAPFVFLIAWLAFRTLPLFENSKQRLDDAFTQRYSYSVGGLGNNSLQDRLYTNRASLERISHNPFFGYGLDINGRVTSTGIETHNYLLLSWQTGGFFFLFFQLVLTIILCRKVLQRPYDKLVICLLICILAFLLSEPWIYERSITSLLFLIYFNRKRNNSITNLA